MKNNRVSIRDWTANLMNERSFYIVVITKKGELKFINSHFYTNLGQTELSVKKNTFFDFIHGHDQHHFKDALQLSEDSGQPAYASIRVKNGHYHWIKWEVNKMYQQSDDHEKFLCLGYDIPKEEQLKQYTHITGKNYQAIVENLNVGVVFQDRKGNMIAANQKTADILGVNIEELYFQDKIYDSLNIQDKNFAAVKFEDAPFMKALQTGETQINVLLNINPGKQKHKTVLCNSQPLFEQNQAEPFSVVSTLIDITAEKKLEQELKAREALFSAFMNNTPYFTWIVDRNGKLVFANQSLLKYFKGDEKAFGSNIFRLIPTNIADIFHEKHLVALKKKQAQHSIIKSFMADGREHVYQVTIFPIHGAEGEIIVGGEALEITEAYHAREEIKKVNERLLYISQATSEAIWDWNMQTGHIFCNEALCDLIGTEINQVSDLNWCYENIHPEDRPNVESKIHRVLERRETSWEMEFRIRHNDYSYKIFHSRGFIIYQDNTALRMICSLRDISEIKNLENKLIEQKLKQQKGIAEAIIQAQEEERRRIGCELHDNINQLLSTAQLYVNLLDCDIENFSEIKQKSRETINLAIDEIRKLSREMAMPNFNDDGLVTSIQSIVDDLTFTCPFEIRFTHGKNCNIESIGQHKKLTLFRIVQEQIKNILKYSEAKHVAIKLDCQPNQLRLEIKDDGKGFDAKNTRRGLGLSNIYERTKLYNGKVVLNTAPGEGCILIVNMPVDTPIIAGGKITFP